MAQQWDAKDKTFIITGGASGLGFQYAKVFLELGAKSMSAKSIAILDVAEEVGKAAAEGLNKIYKDKVIFIKCDVSKEDDIKNAFEISIAILDVAEEVGKAAAEGLNKIYKDKVIFIKCDVSKEDDIKNAFEIVLSQFKQIDVIINNAGIMSDAPNIWRTACSVNWEGLVSFTLKGIKHMRKDEGGAGGTIINISSTAAITQFPFIPVYNGSKMAVLHFSQCISMAPFFDNTNVRVLTMCFGPTDTPLLHNLEARCYEPNLGNGFADMVVAAGVEYQKIESAVKAFVDMFQNGAPGTIWLSVHNRPVKDITPVIDGIFKELEALIG